MQNGKMGQIFSPKKQPHSGGKGIYKINPDQRLLRLEYSVSSGCWKAGRNIVSISMPGKPGSAASSVKLEKVEAHLFYADVSGELMPLF